MSIGIQSELSAATPKATERCHDLAVALRPFQKIFGVPGYPVSHLLDDLSAAGTTVTWSINEKTAIESAVGAALCGVASVVVIKHNGLAMAADSLANAVVHGLAAPMLVVVGDDLDARSSTCVIDSREIAAAIGMVALSPTLRADVRRTVETAVGASNLTGGPVLLRFSGRLHDHCGTPRPESATPARLTFKGNSAEHTHRLTKLSRVVRARTLRASASDLIGTAALDTIHCVQEHDTLIVAVADIEIPDDLGVCIARVYCGEPSEKLFGAAMRHSDVLVVEEGAPIIERQIPSARGSRTGHLPRTGRISPEMVRRALTGHTASEPELTNRPPEALGAQDALFRAISRLRASGIFVATDVGSSVRLSYPPYNGADAALALGASPAVAAGAARAGRSAIAVLGDFGLLHGGLNGLMDITAEGLSVVTLVIENGVQEKTGGQPLPAVDLSALFQGGGLGRVAIWNDENWDEETLYAALVKELSVSEPVVIRYRKSP